MRALQRAGVRVPQDVALAGVGNSGVSDLLACRLTTVHQHPQLMGRTAAELLLEWLSARRIPSRREVDIPISLIVRESSGMSLQTQVTFTLPGK